MKNLLGAYLPKEFVLNTKFLESLYEFILEAIPNLSVEQNIETLLSQYGEILKQGPDLSLIARGGLERDVDHLNKVFNQKKRIGFLADNLHQCNALLNEILTNPSFRKKVQSELENTLFEEPTFATRFMDALVRMLGNRLGLTRHK